MPAARVRPRQAGLRQDVAHVAGEAVDEVVLAAVGLVGDDDDVAPVRKHGGAVPGLSGHELLDRREDDSTAADAELLARDGPVGGHERFPQLVAIASTNVVSSRVVSITLSLSRECQLIAR